MPPKKTTSKPSQPGFPPVESGLYFNHAQVTLSSNELTIDFFYISPKIDSLISGQEKEATVNHIQRFIAPVSMAKGLANAIANVVANYEADNDIVLPTTRIRHL